MDGERGGDAAGGDGIAAAGEHLPALRLRPVGPAVEAAARARRRDRRALRRRLRGRASSIETDAERFLAELRERFAKFGLELHPDKTRLIEFGRYRGRRPSKRAATGKPETFDFLGFTHICAKTRNGRFWLRAHHDQEADAGEAAARSRPSCSDAGICPSPSKGAGWQRPARVLRLLRRARQHRRDQRRFAPGHRHWRGAAAPEPAHATELGADAAASRSAGSHPPASCIPGPTSASTSEPKAGAQCGSTARWDLCGGPPARAVPTAIHVGLL